jgi:IS605 OrfB family transposase
MAKSIDIRKVTLPGCEYYESVEAAFTVTFIGRLKGITPFGHETLLERKPFCRLLRTLVAALQRAEKPDKQALCATFDLPSRVYNTALKSAEGVIASAIECQKVDLEDTEHEINRQVVEAFWGPSGELHGRIRKLKRLYQKRNRLLKQQGRPRIHFGKRFYQHQEESEWKKAYERARNDRIGCLGSSDETGGNSTYQIKAVSQDGNLRFELHHSRKLMGHFHLKPKQREELEAILAINHQPFKFSLVPATQGKRKGQLVRRKITEGRVPLTVWLIQHDNGHWYIHISLSKDRQQPDYAPIGAIGVDLNSDSIADTKVQMADDAPLVVAHQKRVFDATWSKAEKEAWVYAQSNEIVLEAKASRCMVVLEYLDFEHCKRWLRTKLGAMLRVMPYRKIRKAFERRCMEHGVLLRYVKSRYTSILGAILTDYPNLGRDQAAAAIIGLRALEAGNAWLERKSQELGKQERARLRINRKGQFGCTVTTDGVLIERQSEATPLDRETDTHWFQNRVAREISGLGKALGNFFYQKEWLPTRWRRSGPESDPWHPVVSKGDEAPRSRTKCSSLSN